MSNALHVSDTLTLPLELVTESNAILAKKGAGKTSALVVLVEEMYKVGAPVVTIDPKGDHYGIRTSADGKSTGLPIPVFGGRHGDIPLEQTAGALIADLVRERNLSVVLDVSEFTKGARTRFLTDFAARLYRRPERTPMHLFLEECHEYIPQQVSADTAVMVGTFEQLVKGGRFKGIGVTLVSQRSASVNKNVLTQVDNLFVMRTLSPQDRAVVKSWVDTNAEAGDILNTLPTLQNGEAWLWQPERGEPVKFRFRMRHTFDAGATPKMGQVAIVPTTVADVDLDAIAAAMASTIEKAKADDPRALRAELAERNERIAELEAALADAQQAPGETVEVSVLTEEDHHRLSNQANLLHQSVLDLMRGFNEDFAAKTIQIRETADIIKALVEPVLPKPPAIVSTFPSARLMHPASGTAPQEAPRPRPVAVPREPGEGIALGKAHRGILTVLAQRGTPQTVQQVAMLTGYSSTGGGFRNAVGALRSAGYIGPTRDPLAITAEGYEALGEFEQLPVGRELVTYWLNRSAKAEGLILEALLAAWPNTLTAEQVAAITGYEATGGGFRNAIGHLRTLTLITGKNHELRADNELGNAYQN